MNNKGVGLVAAAALALGAGAVAVASNGARESIAVVVGDTITPRFAVRTDTVLRVVGTKILAAKCGQGMIYLRTAKLGNYISADSITVDVSGCGGGTTPPSGASITVCLHSDPDSIAKYHVRGDTTVDPKLIPCLDPK